MVIEFSHVEIRVKIVPDRCNSKCKGPEVRGRRKASVDGEYEKKREGEDIKSERRLSLSYTGP